MKTPYYILREIGFLLSGTFLGIIIIPSADKNILGLLCVFFFLIGIGLLEGVVSVWFGFWRWRNGRQAKIGIYAPHCLVAGKHSWVNVELEVITKLLERKKFKYRVETNENAFKAHHIILNPYGGVYPEKELETLQSLEAVFDFVRKGGIYINIADIPFYYAFDVKLNRRVDTTPFVGDYSGNRSFLQTALTRKLHSLVLGLPEGMNGDKGITRVIEVSDNENNLFKSDFPNGGRKFSPVLKIPYGKGFFVFSTIQINPNNMKKNIKRVVKAARKL